MRWAGQSSATVDTIRVITRLTNERSGATLWTDNFNYDGKEVSKVPRHIAVDAGNVVRCGLFGASTYHKPLPDQVLRDYMQFCQGHWDPEPAGGAQGPCPRATRRRRRSGLLLGLGGGRRRILESRNERGR